MGDIKIYNIEEIIERCNIDYFVETGTLLGDAVEHARGYNLKKIISFEIIEELVDKAKSRFEGDEK